MSKQDVLKSQTCVVRVNIDCDGCKAKVSKLLKKTDGVYTSKIDMEKGMVTVSGDVDPAVLIKKLNKSGKRAELWNPPSSQNKPPKNDKNNDNKEAQMQQLLKSLQIAAAEKAGGAGKDMIPHQKMLNQQHQQLHHRMKLKEGGAKDQSKSVKFADLPNSNNPNSKKGHGDDDEDYDDFTGDKDLEDDDEDYDDEDDDYYDDDDDNLVQVYVVPPKKDNKSSSASDLATLPAVTMDAKSSDKKSGEADDKPDKDTKKINDNTTTTTTLSKNKNKNKNNKDDGGGGGGGGGFMSMIGFGKAGKPPKKDDKGTGGIKVKEDAAAKDTNKNDDGNKKGNVDFQNGNKKGKVDIQNGAAAAAAAAGGTVGGGPGPYFQGIGMGPANPHHHHQQQQYTAAMMNQQRMINGNGDHTIPMYGRPPPGYGAYAAVPYGYGPPPPPPSYHDPITHMFSDENTSGCAIM